MAQTQFVHVAAFVAASILGAHAFPASADSVSSISPVAEALMSVLAVAAAAFAVGLCLFPSDGPGAGAKANQHQQQVMNSGSVPANAAAAPFNNIIHTPVVYEDGPAVVGAAASQPQASYGEVNRPDLAAPSQAAPVPPSSSEPSPFYVRDFQNGVASFKPIDLAAAETMMQRGERVFRMAQHPDAVHNMDSEELYEELPNQQALYSTVPKKPSNAGDIYAMPVKNKNQQQMPQHQAAASNHQLPPVDGPVYGNVNPTATGASHPSSTAYTNGLQHEQAQHGQGQAPVQQDASPPPPVLPRHAQSSSIVEPTYVPLEEQNQPDPEHRPELYQAVMETHYKVEEPTFVKASNEPEEERLLPFENDRVSEWLEHPVSRQDAERYLAQAGMDAGFLTRRSPKNPADVVLSLYHQNQTFHFRIVNHGMQVMIHDEKNPPRPFHTLEQLILYYKRHDCSKPGGLPTQLGTCIAKP